MGCCFSLLWWQGLGAAFTRGRASASVEKVPEEAVEVPAKVEPSDRDLSQKDAPDPEEAKHAAWMKTQPPGRLTAKQDSVMRDAHRRAKRASAAALPLLAKRFEVLGFPTKALPNVLEYIREGAPIVIHFDPRKKFEESTVLDGFKADCEYRNLFETHISGGVIGDHRDDKERKLFAGLYHLRGDPSPEERPKYGSLNLFQLPGGSAPSYGPCYLELDDDVRNRTTFTWGQSSWEPTQPPATCQHFAHILQRFSDAQLGNLVSWAPSAESVSADEIIMEAQIHGRGGLLVRRQEAPIP